MPSCSLQAVAKGTTVAAGASSAIGEIQSAHAQSAAASYQAQIAENQQKIRQQQAQQTAAATEAATEQQEMKNRANLGAIVAARDAIAFAMRCWYLHPHRMASGNQAGLHRAEATQAPIAGAFGAAGSLLSGASSAGSQYMEWKQEGGSGAFVRVIMQILHRRVTHAEVAHRCRYYSMHDGAARQVFGIGSGEFYYLRKKHGAAEIAGVHDRGDLHAPHHRHEWEWRELHRRREREARDIRGNS
jgi:Sec-independent protein translocase protein TatA